MILSISLIVLSLILLVPKKLVKPNLTVHEGGKKQFFV